MPCYDGRDVESREEEQEQIALTTKLLCATCRILSPIELRSVADGALFAWYWGHLIHDQAQNKKRIDGEGDYNFASLELIRINRCFPKYE